MGADEAGPSVTNYAQKNICTSVVCTSIIYPVMNVLADHCTELAIGLELGTSTEQLLNRQVAMNVN